ncbi:MAG TPA: hypothetical protein VK581_11070 [Chthoniobacterales bacterium]|jgi:hypothetical protein|nr:hypothetical protein [Chthoniobacterales bacterium]
MRTIAAFALILIGNCFVSSLEAKDIIRDKSPDGKFALRFTRDDKGTWEAAIINLESKDEEAGLELYQNGNIEGAHLVWSSDSQRVAYFEPDRRGGGTKVYFRKASEFEEVPIPYGDPYKEDFAACEANRAEKSSGDTSGKDVEATSRPVKWLRSGELVLAVHFERLMENGTTRACGQTITIAFDPDHKASVKSVKQRD